MSVYCHTHVPVHARVCAHTYTYTYIHSHPTLTSLVFAITHRCGFQQHKASYSLFGPVFFFLNAVVYCLKYLLGEGMN